MKANMLNHIQYLLFSMPTKTSVYPSRWYLITYTY